MLSLDVAQRRTTVSKPVILVPPIPAETAQAVNAVFGKGNTYIMIGDELNSLFASIDLAQLDSGNPKADYMQLIYGLVTHFQFAERLPDHRAAAALHSRLDWKYALHLPLNHSGMSSHTLCEFRHQLWDDPLGQQAFQLMIDAMAGRGWLSLAAGSTADRLISSVCNLSRIEQLVDNLCAALEALAASRPDWLLKTALPHWYDRYTKRQSLRDLPNTLPDQFALAQAIGLDAAHLLGAVELETELKQLLEIRLLRRAYSRQFDLIEDEVRWRSPQCLVCPLAT